MPPPPALPEIPASEGYDGVKMRPGGHVAANEILEQLGKEDISATASVDEFIGRIDTNQNGIDAKDINFDPKAMYIIADWLYRFAPPAVKDRNFASLHIDELCFDQFYFNPILYHNFYNLNYDIGSFNFAVILLQGGSPTFDRPIPTFGTQIRDTVAEDFPTCKVIDENGSNWAAAERQRFSATAQK